MKILIKYVNNYEKKILYLVISRQEQVKRERSGVVAKCAPGEEGARSELFGD